MKIGSNPRSEKLLKLVPATPLVCLRGFRKPLEPQNVLPKKAYYGWRSIYTGKLYSSQRRSQLDKGF
jgi:hypothetical protein